MYISRPAFRAAFLCVPLPGLPGTSPSAKECHPEPQGGEGSPNSTRRGDPSSVSPPQDDNSGFLFRCCNGRTRSPPCEGVSSRDKAENARKHWDSTVGREAFPKLYRAVFFCRSAETGCRLTVGAICAYNWPRQAAHGFSCAAIVFLIPIRVNNMCIRRRRCRPMRMGQARSV